MRVDAIFRVSVQVSLPNLSYGSFVLWRVDSFLGNGRETENTTTSVTRQQPARQWTGWKEVFSVRSAPMATHGTVDTTMATKYKRLKLGGGQAYDRSSE
jgi:hypothetical protein